MLVPASPVDSEDEKEEADAALVNDLLEPMIKSTIYTAESLNRRQVCSCDQRRHGQTGVLLKVLPLPATNLSTGGRHRCPLRRRRQAVVRERQVLHEEAQGLLEHTS